MPLYDFRCPEGHEFDRFLSLKDYNEPQVCDCGLDAKKVIKPTMVNCDIAPWDAYESPATGKMITSYKERDADMKASGCVDYDPGMRTDSENRKKAEDLKLDKEIDATVGKAFSEMPSKDKEKLTNELSRTELEYTRT